MAADLIVDDGFITDRSKEISSAMKKMDSILNAYFSCLTTLRERAIKEGATAEALSAFTTYALELRNFMTDFANSISSVSTKYLADIDKADKYLF